MPWTWFVKLITLGHTLHRRVANVLAYFDRPGTSNGPTDAINGRFQHLRGTALVARNLTNSIARSRLETGGFRPQLPSIRMSLLSSFALPADERAVASRTRLRMAAAGQLQNVRVVHTWRNSRVPFDCDFLAVAD